MYLVDKKKHKKGGKKRTFSKRDTQKIQTCVYSFVNLQILTSGEHFATSRKWTREWFFSGVNPDVIDQFILGFERFEFPCTLLPITRVIGLLRSPDMVYSDMIHNFMHCVKHFVAGLLGLGLFRIYPETSPLLLNGGSPDVRKK